MISNPFSLSAAEIAAALGGEHPALPELEALRADPAALAALPGMRFELEQTAPLMAGIERIPQTRYTHYRYFIKNGDRRTYEGPYFDKRRNLGALALRVLVGETQWKDLLQDYIWDICEESTWVLPAHERRDFIDLFSAETGFDLATTLHLLGRSLDGEVRARVRSEVDQRIFQPYLAHFLNYHWYLGVHNWNGVCNSSVASAFLLLESEPDRQARALELAFAGLQHYLQVAFESDGASTEGVGYWHYGLINFISLSEMLRARSGGEIDLLASQRMKDVAGYPAKLHLSGSMFAAFSDADETTEFNPGIVTRLAERTGEPSLYNLLAKPVHFKGDWRLTMMLRNALWWDGAQLDAPAIQDAVLPAGGVARLAVERPDGLRVIAAIKAGHNAENHNQNDIGSFLVHVDGENLLTDPGRGLYNRFYFSERRYENIFANSYGHSLPRIGGQLQHEGRQHYGELGAVELGGPVKRVTVDFPRAYAVEALSGLRRTLALDAQGGLLLEDQFSFSGAPLEVEEAFVTWGQVELDGASATVRGARHSLRLTIEAPAGASFAVQSLAEDCRANARAGVLQRISAVFPHAPATSVRIRMQVL